MLGYLRSCRGVLCFVSASLDEYLQGVCCVVVTSAVQFWLVLPGH
jgi:hypothetical protein